MRKRDVLKQKIKSKFSKNNRPFPLERSENDQIPEGYKGLVITSDIDQTYLQTNLDSLVQLAKIALEKAEDKKCIPGMDLFLKALTLGKKPREWMLPLYFVSASPPQMRDVLEKKMELDGLQPFGITFKDQIRLAGFRRSEQFKSHVLYKLTALLLNRMNRPTNTEIEEILVGDDTETDALSYELYARLIHGDYTPQDFEELSKEWNPTDFEKQQLLDMLQKKDASRVVRIYIHRTVKSPLPSNIQDNPLFVFANNAFEMALDAFEQGWISFEDLQTVGNAFTIYERLETFLRFLENNESVLLPEQVIQILEIPLQRVQSS